MITKKRLHIIYATSLLTLLLSAGSDAQNRSPNASENSYRRAREIVGEGLRALGGADALRAIKVISLKETGKQFHVNQDVQPFAPFGGGVTSDSFVVDFTGNRFVREFEGNFPGLKARQKIVITGGEGITVDLLARTVRPFPNAAVANQRGQLRKLPHLVLFEALERATTLRWLGEDIYNGRKQAVVTFVRADNQQTTLYFDARTNLLTKFEFLYTDNGAGDSRQEHIFPAYRTVGKFKIPTGRTMTFAGHVWQEAKYTDVTFDFTPDESLFAVPADYAKLPPITPPTPGISRLAPDVYLLRGSSHNSLFVVFNDYVLAVDAPEPSPPFNAVSEGFIRRIKETAPNKPIRYLVPTHHHSDHSGGARAYVAEGATVVTTPGNRRFFEELVAKPYTFVEDALARAPRKPVIETVENKKRVFRDDKHAVEIYDIGPSPHAEEMLVVYLPKEKILFQSDLFSVPDEQTAPFAQEPTIHLAEAITRLGIDVERIVGGHGIVTTAEKLRATVEKR